MSQPISQISLSRLLPQVFRGMEAAERIQQSAVWLEDAVTLERGCRLCIQAESGSGKSSLLSFIYGNRGDYDGQICFDGQDIRGLDTAAWCEIRRRHLALLPQEMRLFPELTVMQNLRLKNQLTHHKTEDEMLALLDRLGIADKAEKPVAQLSIGQQQRVAIIRAVCQPFDFILLDEPVSHLDRNNNLIVAEIVAEEATRNGASIVSTSVGHGLLLDGAQTICL